MTIEPNSIEPSEEEYEAIGGELLGRVRRRERRVRRTQLLVTGLSAASVTAMAMAGGIALWPGLGVGGDSGTGPETAAGISVSCYSSSGPSADVITLQRSSPNGRDALETFAVESCTRAWEAGLFGEAAGRSTAGMVSGDYTGAGDGGGENAGDTAAEMPDDESDREGLEDPFAAESAARAPSLQACPQLDGTIAVFPDEDQRGTDLCTGIEGGSGAR